MKVYRARCPAMLMTTAALGVLAINSVALGQTVAGRPGAEPKSYAPKANTLEEARLWIV